MCLNDQEIKRLDQMNYDPIVIRQLLRNEKPILTHGKDLDGLISAVFAMKMFDKKDSTIIPMDYGLLNDNHDLKNLIDSKRFLAVLDFEYLGEWTRLYCDHHVSNRGSEMKGDIILFDSESPSAAEILAKYLGVSEEKWGTVSRADSASYDSEPPSFKVSEKEDLGSPDYDVAWDYTDLVKNTDNSRQFRNLALDFYEFYFGDGVDPRFKHINKIRDARRRRRRTERLTEEIYDIYDNEKVILFLTTNNLNDEVSVRGVIHSLYEKGLQLGIEAVSTDGGYNYFFGANNDHYDLDLYPLDIASELGGGGHKMASGARASLNELDKVLGDIEYRKIDVREVYMKII